MKVPLNNFVSYRMGTSLGTGAISRLSELKVGQELYWRQEGGKVSNSQYCVVYVAH